MFARFHWLVFEPETSVVVYPVQQLFIRFKMFTEPVILSGVFAGVDPAIIANYADESSYPDHTVEELKAVALSVIAQLTVVKNEAKTDK